MRMAAGKEGLELVIQVTPVKQMILVILALIPLQVTLMILVILVILVILGLIFPISLQSTGVPIPPDL